MAKNLVWLTGNYCDSIIDMTDSYLFIDFTLIFLLSLILEQFIKDLQLLCVRITVICL